MSAVLELRSVSKRFGSHLAVDDVSVEVAQGSFFALLGPSGCGKTTTLRLIAGLEDATQGDILLHGDRINHLKPYERPVSTVFQNYALFPHLTARGNIEFGLKRQRLGRDEILRRVDEAVALMRLGAKQGLMPAQLSGGERQRVALARSLVLRPDVLLLDEPLSALDPNLRRRVRGELKQLQRQIGITFVFVTHDQEEALSLSDSIAVMRSGRLEQVGAPMELYTKPKTRFVAGFLGSVNWIDRVGIRPEMTRVSREVPRGLVRSVAGVVESSTFLGNCMHVHARLPEGALVTAEVAPDMADFSDGDAVHMWWHPHDELTGLHDKQ
jgi:ABC-type Fe3+/spermidine/putrescine transport system ATPase subunit